MPRSSERDQARALAAQQSGDHGQAVTLFQRALAAAPNDFRLHHHLGLSQRALGRLPDAERSFRAAAAGGPRSAVTHGCLGNVLRQLGRLDEAIASHLRAVELEPGSPEALSNLALDYQMAGRLDASLLCIEEAVRLRPDDAELLHNLAAVLVRAERMPAAEAAARAAIARKPTHAGAWVNLGAAVKAAGRFDEATECFRRAIAADASNADAHFNLGLVLLLMGRYKEGWEEREWRVHIPEVGPAPYRGAARAWDGSPLDGRTLLLRSEQGLGDSVQFIRYARVIRTAAGARGGRILFECPAALMRLLEGARDLDGVVAAGAPCPAVDLEAPLLSVPHILRAALPEPPAGEPYLSAEPSLVERWRRRFASDGPTSLRIGIGWQGNPRYPADRLRSVPLAAFRPLLDAARSVSARVYSLQKGFGREQLAALTDSGIVDLGGELDEHGPGTAFVDTVAAAQSLDLVVTSDTALAHLMGAVGVRVFVLIPFVPDWRWGLGGERSPWYPSMRLFRQERPGDWGDVLERAAQAARGLGSDRSPSASR